jgi:hypothetical protein
MSTVSPAKLYALVVGGVLVIAGIVGFAYSSSFGSPGEVDTVFGILDVNAWHNIVHIATGLLGLALFRTAAREYALGLGAVYLVVTIWGFIVGDGESILGFIPVNTEDNVLHLLLGLAGIGAGLATRPEPTAATPGGAAPAH